MTDEQRAPQFYDVPAGAKCKPCDQHDCGAMLYLIDSPKGNGKKIPIDCSEKVGGVAPTDATPGQGINHFRNCTNPRRFHRPVPAKRPTSTDQTELPVAHRGHSCIVCGCTEGKPCQIAREELDLVSEDVQTLLRFGGETSSEDLSRMVPCSWLSVDPPVCDAPICRKTFDEMPLAMRLRAQRALQPVGVTS